uniref:RING-type domain-containing protein n=1 Tax=Oreochromis niloticus TaxID=8128 RepID=A0A669EQL4_ORENI
MRSFTRSVTVWVTSLDSTLLGRSQRSTGDRGNSQTINFWARLRYYRHLEAHREQERKEFNRLLAEAARQQNNVPGQDNLQGVAMCVICLNQPCICVLLDCGHVCCCHTCYQALPQQYCPICRQRIVRVLPLYQV